jgi:histidine triad (HIT) family protein
MLRYLLRPFLEKELASCPFCQLAATPAAHELYRDEALFVVLDRDSLAFGHCMIIPKRHVTKVYELSNDECAALFALAAKFARILEAKLQVKAVGLMAFGSGLPHAHLHLVPHDNPRVLTHPDEYLKTLSADQLSSDAHRMRELLVST